MTTTTRNKRTFNEHSKKTESFASVPSMAAALPILLLLLQAEVMNNKLANNIQKGTNSKQMKQIISKQEQTIKKLDKQTG